MAGVLVWLARHGRAMTLGSVALALVLLVGGVTLGMATSGSAPAQAAGQAKLAQATRHYLVGTVVERLGANTVIVRNKAGRYFIVTHDATTRVRRNGSSAAATAVRRGTRVTILGNPSSDGFHAAVVTITGTTPAAKLPKTVPQQSRKRPAASPTPAR
jgi:hypothetical protein